MSHFQSCISRLRTGTVLVGAALLFSLVAFAQEPGNAPETAAPASSEQSPKKHEANKADERPGFGAQLAKETREAAGEDETAQFKQSASVRWLSKFTGGNLQHAYWLAVLLNFLVIAVVLGWAAGKYLPGMFHERTVSIQRAMEEARRASEDANRRLGEIESRLARLDD